MSDAQATNTRERTIRRLMQEAQDRIHDMRMNIDGKLKVFELLDEIIQLGQIRNPSFLHAWMNAVVPALSQEREDLTAVEALLGEEAVIEATWNT